MIRNHLKIATEAAKKGGSILKKYWGKLSRIETKKFSGDLVTEADQESEEVILNYLREQCPDYAIIAEESGRVAGENTEYAWVVDPLDGTTNYTHQYPLVCISIGLVQNGKPIIGVIYNPIHDELYAAGKGLGATLNGEKCVVSQTDQLGQSLLETGFAYDRVENPDNNYPEFCHLTQLTQGVRRSGSAALALAYVAAGRLDGFWERGLNPWDIAAGVCLIEEAGGKVTAYSGGPLDLESGRILATNGKIHGRLSDELLKVEAKNIRYFS